MDTSQIPAFVLALVWFISAGVVVYLMTRWRRQANVWLKTEGVVSRTWTHSNQGTMSYYAAYSFLAPDGQKRFGDGRTSGEYQGNDIIDVWYDPEDPDQNKPTATDLRSWYMIGGNLIFAFVAAGVVTLLEGFSVIDLF